MQIFNSFINFIISGGDKRKLRASLAIIGNPEIILLDEPTTGMGE